jgi:hypothetical protein
MSRKLEDSFPLVITHNAIRVTKDAFKITSDSPDCIVSWVECYNKEEIGTDFKPESILVVTDLEGFMITDPTAEKQAKLAAMAFRVRQIQEEYEITPFDSVTYTNLISKILERVWAGEWMGQFNSGKCIYFNELADLLNLPMVDIWSIVEELVTLRKADVLPSSWILVAPEGEEPRKGTEELLGHREYSSSDFGYWSCAFCEQNGDDYSSPQDYPCIKSKTDVTKL